MLMFPLFLQLTEAFTPEFDMDSISLYEPCNIKLEKVWDCNVGDSDLTNLSNKTFMDLNQSFEGMKEGNNNKKRKKRERHDDYTNKRINTNNDT